MAASKWPHCRNTLPRLKCACRRQAVSGGACAIHIIMSMINSHAFMKRIHLGSVAYACMSGSCCWWMIGPGGAQGRRFQPSPHLNMLRHGQDCGLEGVLGLLVPPQRAQHAACAGSSTQQVSHHYTASISAMATATE